MAKAQKPNGGPRSGPYKRNTGRKQQRGAVTKEPVVQQQDSGDEEMEEQSEAQLGDEPQLNAYDALLTLLKPGEEETQKKTKKRVKKRDDDAVEGFEGGEEEDEVEEADEDEGVQVDDDDEKDFADHFNSHFSHPHERIVETLSTLKEAAKREATKNKTAEKPIFKFKGTKSKMLGDKSVLDVPDLEFGSVKKLKSLDEKMKVETEQSQQVAIGKPHAVRSISSLKLKYRLVAPFTRENGDLTDLQKEFGSPLFAYQDMLYSQRSLENAQQLQNMYILHAMNHIYKTRDRILKNNAKLASARTEGGAKLEQLQEEAKDQGFTRAKVLVLLPTKNSCWKFINKVMSISGLNQSENKKRFKDAFYDPAATPTTKPLDFQDFFAGDTDDLFCLGVKFTRQAVKLYSSFYSCDLIVASPLGLQRIITSKSKPDRDFLSSVELTIVDQADGIYMQNWDNVNTVLKNMNIVPNQSHGCDFMRVRNWYINETAQCFRQTIILSEYVTPEMNHTMAAYCHNVAGKLRVKSLTPGVMGRIGERVNQTFTRIHPTSLVNDPEARFKHFTSAVLPSLMRGADHTGTLVYIPSYNDFLRVRRYVEVNRINCTCVSEYDEASHISRARTFFSKGDVKILFISERFHNYRRYEIKGVRQVVMYGIPQNPKFYTEVMRFMVRNAIETGTDIGMYKARVLYSKFDSLALQRVVGSERMGQLMFGQEDAYEFH